MTSSPRTLAAASSLALLAIALGPRQRLEAQRAPLAGPVAYELRSGSRLVDGCKDCDRIPIVRPLAGRFVLEAIPSLPGADRFAVTELELNSPEGDYTLRGSGTYSRIVTPEYPQKLELDLSVNGVPGVALASEIVPANVPLPVIDVEVTEDGDRDPAHLYTVRIVAAPKVPLTAYELLEGSTFVDDCLPCMRPTIPVPIRGTFLLGEIEGPPNPISTYVVDAVDFSSTDEPQSYRLTGWGFYRQGGEVALSQFMSLELAVIDPSGAANEGAILANDDPKVPAKFPEIEIELAHKNPVSDLHVYSLRILARPIDVPPLPEFRRGDANADGGVDISDAVSTLLWLFVGAAEPPCLEAADSDATGEIVLTDAVYTLQYLFQGGNVPPAPGPETCGTAPEPLLGCANYPNC